MKKKLLVVGDSFMLPDSEYVNRHWSEMLPEYEIMMYSQSGSSNGMIAYQFFQGLKHNPDVVVIGFSAPERIEFNIDPRPENKFVPARWVTGSHPGLNSVQKLAADYYSMSVCQEMQFFKNLVMARSMFLTLQKQKIPFAYSYNLLHNDLSNHAKASLVNEFLNEFRARECPTNLATYPDWKASPGFHTDDLIWQQRFAQEVREIVEIPIDFSQQTK
jgi:hypothetical protein